MSFFSLTIPAGTSRTLSIPRDEICHLSAAVLVCGKRKKGPGAEVQHLLKCSLKGEKNFKDAVLCALRERVAENCSLANVFHNVSKVTFTGSATHEVALSGHFVKMSDEDVAIENGGLDEDEKDDEETNAKPEEEEDDDEDEDEDNTAANKAANGNAKMDIPDEEDEEEDEDDEDEDEDDEDEDADEEDQDADEDEEVKEKTKSETVKRKASPVEESSTPKRPKVIKLRGGLKYRDIKVGSGKPAKQGSTISVRYRGLLKSGIEFDSNLPKGKPFSFTLGAGEVVKGWDQGLVGMKVGGRRELVIPPHLGYGQRGAGPKIPPNATLLFEVQLLKAK
mmetsp:Transcript_10414/g.25474  ORF Transcript_10414/g.25474 Transcript_10414/m.25474 type:complete len:336 (+) Transcript_10414:51-1058(+)